MRWTGKENGPSPKIGPSWMQSCWIQDPGGVASPVRPEGERMPQPTEEDLREWRKAGGQSRANERSL
jgi:hypothetical protein